MRGSRFSTPAWGSRWAKSWIAGSLGLSMLLGSGAIAIGTLLATPQVAQAYTFRSTLLVPRNPDEEGYQAFLRQCEAITRASIQQTFDADLLVSEVIVTVVGDNKGIAVPVMEVPVTRREWEARPDPQEWARYYDNASALLDM